MFGYLTFNSRTVSSITQPQTQVFDFAFPGCYSLSQRNSYHIVYYARNLRYGWEIMRTPMSPENMKERLTRSLPKKTRLFNLFTFWVEQVNEQVKLQLTVQRFKHPFL